MANQEYIRETGTYKVVVSEAVVTTSKAGNPMLTVEFKDLADGRLIRSWFVVTNEWGLKRLAAFKQAIGLSNEAKALEMVGGKLQIFVQPQKDNPKYSEVVNFLPFDTAQIKEDEALPF